MKKAELMKIWKQLDKCANALERLGENQIADKDGYVFSEIVSIRNEVEELIEKKSRKPVEFL